MPRSKRSKTQRRRTLALALLGLPLLVIPGALAAPTVTIGPETQVTSDGPMWEVAETADPSNPSKLAITSIVGTASSPPQSEVFVTTNGGASWSRTYITSGRGEGDFDPTITACPEHRGHAVYLFGYLDQSQTFHLMRSANDGSTWSSTWNSPTTTDHPRMAVDPSDPNGAVGLYIAGKDEASHNLRVWYLTGGCSSTPHATELDAAASVAPLNSIVVYRDHTVGFFYQDVPVSDGAGGYYQSYSVIEGKWAGAPPNATLTLGDATSMFTLHDKVYNKNNGGQMDSQFVRAPSSDTLYATLVNWTKPRVAPWLEIVSSTDRGRTWSSPVAVDTPPSGYLADGQSELMINASGTIGVSFLRAVRALGQLGQFPCYSYDAFFTASFDGGQSWSTPTKLDNAMSIPDCIKQEGGGQARWTGGDYTVGAADASGAFHPIWPDWRLGPLVPGSLYTRGATAP